VSVRGGNRAGGSRRGALLLEVILSLAMFAMAAMAILAALTQGTTALERVRDAALAVDLARTAMAEIEAGVASPATLNGPVPAWHESARAEESGAFADAPPSGTGWELVVETSPSGFPELTHVRVTSRKVSPMGATLASYTLHQLVRLGALAEDEVGAEDELMDAIRRGEREREREERFNRPDPFERDSPLDRPGRFDPPARRPGGAGVGGGRP